MIVIYTRAYNAETTLCRAVDSVLNQTCPDFRYILFNNGSNDATLDIMRDYARRDKRVIVFSNETNMMGFNSCKSILQFIANNFAGEDYFCNIDADDAYRPDFFEKMLAFVTENQLETAFCGYNAIERGTGKLLECKKFGQDLVLSNCELPYHYRSFRRYCTDVWGKFFKVSLLQYYFREERFANSMRLNNVQQNFIFETLQNSAYVGFLAEPLLDYYVSGPALQNMRSAGMLSTFQSKMIFEINKNFLDHFSVPEELRRSNLEYLYAVYCGYISDLLERIKLNNSYSLINKINFMFEIFSYYVTQEMLCLQADPQFYSLRPEAKEDLCRGAVSFLVGQKGWERYRYKVEQIVSYMQKCGIAVSMGADA